MSVLTIGPPSDIRKSIQGHHDLFDFQRAFHNQRAAAPKYNRPVARGLGQEKGRLSQFQFNVKFVLRVYVAKDLSPDSRSVIVEPVQINC